MSEFAIEASRAVRPYFYRAPHSDRIEPREFQFAAAEYAIARDHCIIGDAPGVGKTGEALLVGNAIEAKNSLVVCPASLRLNWDREIRMWSTIGGLRTYPVLKATDGIGPHSHYTIISYDLLQNKGIFEALMQQRWDHLILSEAHALKDYKGNMRTKAICGWTDSGTYRPGLADVSGRITMETGTLLPNQPIECYNAIRLLDWSAIDEMSVAEFRRFYYGYGSGFVRIRGKVQWSDRVLNVPRNLDHLQSRLRRFLMVRRLKEDVLHELPPKHWHVFPLAITPGMRRALKHPGWALAEKLYQMDVRAFDTGIPVDGAVSTARRLLGEAKAPATKDYINDLIDSGVNKIVVAAWHHSVLDYFHEKLQHHGLVYMDGSTSPVNKQKAVDMFQFDDQVTIILGQMGPLGTGWSLTAAQDVVNAEPDWVPGKNEQLLDRPHRIGQAGSYVLGHIPVVPGTMDELILSRAIEKDGNINKALDKQ